jgi:hypothetical protein
MRIVLDHSDVHAHRCGQGAAAHGRDNAVQIPGAATTGTSGSGTPGMAVHDRFLAMKGSRTWNWRSSSAVAGYNPTQVGGLWLNIWKDDKKPPLESLFSSKTAHSVL